MPSWEALAGLLCFAEIARVEIRLPAVLFSHAVLQKADKVPVWVWADAKIEGDTVLVWA